MRVCGFNRRRLQLCRIRLDNNSTLSVNNTSPFDFSLLLPRTQFAMYSSQCRVLGQIRCKNGMCQMKWERQEWFGITLQSYLTPLSCNVWGLLLILSNRIMGFSIYMVMEWTFDCESLHFIMVTAIITIPPSPTIKFILEYFFIIPQFDWVLSIQWEQN